MSKETDASHDGNHEDENIGIFSYLEEGSSSEHEGGEDNGNFSSLQLFTFLSLAVTVIVDNASYYMKEPFFPIIAKEKGITETETGLIFGIHFLIAFVFSLIVGKCIPIFGTKVIFLTGLAISGLTDIMYIYILKIQPRNSLVIASIFTECIAAIGSAATDTTALAIVGNVFPKCVTKMVGMVETFSGIASLIGPPVGSYLFEIGGGYETPFLVFGIITGTCLIVNIFLLPSCEKSAYTSGCTLKLLRIPAVYPICLLVFAVSFCDGFVQPIIALYVKQEQPDVSIGFIGSLFFLVGAVYTIFASLCGWFADMKENVLIKPMGVLGLFILALSFLIMGPSPIFKIPDTANMFVLALGLATLSIGSALSYVPAYPSLIAISLDRGMDNELGTQGIVAGLIMAFFCFGSFLGPITGSILYQHLGFAFATTSVSIFCLVSCVVLITVYLRKSNCR